MNDPSRARRVLEAAVTARVFPGAVVEVGRAAGALATIAEGRLSADPDSGLVDARTVYDLASLTKPLATTMLALTLVQRDALRVDDRVARWIPEWRGDDRQHITVRQLLDHSSGLPAHRRYFETQRGRIAFEWTIAEEPLVYAPGSQSVYSDPGFMLLGFLLEGAGGAPLDQQFDAWRDDEIGRATSIRFQPPPAWRPRTAPTEDDPWRGRLLCGEVHDENAAALGGVAGHAGLFGTAAAVGACARWWLRLVTRGAHGRTDRTRQLTNLAQMFVTRGRVPASSRALGWDTMLPTSSCGSRMSARAFGHTGFTGTSLWIDPGSDDDGYYVVLLSNRVHPSRAGEGIADVRRALHDAVADDLGRP